ncbi:protein white-like [Anabrus simplex]|uniref:protein white-like n=1 Tax=Anabrus simplex TaxID=316456 RepID=UPI0035A28A71
MEESQALSDDHIQELRERLQAVGRCCNTGSVSDPGVLCMDTLRNSPNAGPYMNETGEGEGIGDDRTPRPTSPRFEMSQNRIVYTWSEMNVFTSGETRRQWRNLLGMRSSALDLQQRQRKQILKNVNGIAYPGELLAIMGSSGAGKTTLLNTLMFRSPPTVLVTGQRAINGFPVSSNTLASLSAYVQQDDLFIGTLTVREHLVFQALVRMDRHIPYKQRMRRVEEVISELALTKCQNTIIGIPGRIKGISGGEMKRLSFASEVLTDPPLMFCDEPISGLDSFMAQNVVLVLKNMALKGKTVVCTIHQPSSEVFALFDKILLMAEGRVAYIGTPEGACTFFAEMGAVCPSNYNPPDFFIQLLAVVPTREESCRQTIDLVCDAFQRSEQGLRLMAESESQEDMQVKAVMAGGEDPWQSVDKGHSPYKASWLAQFRAALWRSWLSVMKEPILIRVRMLQNVMVALLVGVIYYGQQLTQDGVKNINGAVFVFLTNMTFQNVFAVINVFCSELPVFMREHFNGMYRTDVYFLSKTLAEVPIFIAIPIIFTAIAYYLVGFNPAPERFFLAMFIVTLVANVATSFGYLISCVSTSVSMAFSIGPPVVIPFSLFGGYYINTGSVPVYFKWLSYLSWFRYANEALLINQWTGVDSVACTRSNSTCPRNGHVVLETLNFSEDDLMMDIWSLVALIVGFRFLAYLALLFRTLRSE